MRVNPVLNNFQIVVRPKHLAPFMIVHGSSGFVACDQDGDYWCKHIKKAIIEGLDAPLWWERDEEKLTQLYLKIPMFPNTDQWEDVTLHPIEGMRRYRVGWWPPGSSQQSQDSSFLTFINPGDGMNVIRLTLVEQMYADARFATDTLECEAGHHSFHAQTRWEKEIQDEQLRIPALWSVFTSKQCLQCRLDTKLSMEADDLIPEKSSIW